MIHRRGLIQLVGAGVLSSVGPNALAAQAAPTVAAASDLNAALPEIVQRFARRTGQTVRVSYGSSGAFTQQILNGAPFEVFLSADEGYVRRLAVAGKTDGSGALYGVGRVGLFAPRRSRLRVDGQLQGLRAALRSGRVRRFAIANPEHAPYGRAAREALQSFGLWAAIAPRLVLGENVAQATQFATSGSADGGIIPLALAVTPQVKAAGSFALIDASRHKPLRQRAVVLKGAGRTARAFFDFLQSAEARGTFRRFGFVLPGER